MSETGLEPVLETPLVSKESSQHMGPDSSNCWAPEEAGPVTITTLPWAMGSKWEKGGVSKWEKNLLCPSQGTLILRSSWGHLSESLWRLQGEGACRRQQLSCSRPLAEMLRLLAPSGGEDTVIEFWGGCDLCPEEVA